MDSDTHSDFFKFVISITLTITLPIFIFCTYRIIRGTEKGAKDGFSWPLIKMSEKFGEMM